MSESVYSVSFYPRVASASYPSPSKRRTQSLGALPKDLVDKEPRSPRKVGAGNTVLSCLGQRLIQALPSTHCALAQHAKGVKCT